MAPRRRVVRVRNKPAHLRQCDGDTTFARRATAARSLRRLVISDSDDENAAEGLLEMQQTANEPVKDRSTAQPAAIPTHAAGPRKGAN